MALLSDPAYADLAHLLNTIEGGAPWPQGMNTAKAVFMEKGQNGAGDPRPFIVLLFLPALYRRRAAVRPECLRPWVAGWSLPGISMGADRPGRKKPGIR